MFVNNLYSVFLFALITIPQTLFAFDAIFSFDTSYFVGTTPIALEVGDLNGDSHMDFIIANHGSQNFIGFINDGEGTFSPTRSYSTNGTPTSLAIGDINNDGFNDIIVTNYHEDKIVFRYGQGNGIFRESLEFQVFVPIAIGVANLDNICSDDLVVVQPEAYSVTILKNREYNCLPFSGYFTYAGRYPIDLVIFDAENDGDLDVAVANNRDLPVIGLSVLYNRGDGLLENRSEFDIDGGAEVISSGDFDGDGFEDLVVGKSDYWGAGIAVAINDGYGVFDSISHYPLSGTIVDIITADFDGVQGTDLAVSSSEGGGRISIFLNTGDGTFALPIHMDVLELPYAIASYDIDCDRDMDLIVTWVDRGKVAIFTNHTAKEIVSMFPSRMYTAMTHEIEKHYAAFTIKNFPNKHSVVDVDTNSIKINGDIIPSTFSLHYPDLNPCDQYIRAEFSIKEFLLGYGQMWDTTYANFEVTGRYLDSTEFVIEGEVTIIGHRSGDLNRDGQSNVQDLAVLIDFIFRGGSLPDIEGVAEVNGSCGTVNIADLTYFVNYLFRSGPAPFHDCSE